LASAADPAFAIDPDASGDLTTLRLSGVFATADSDAIARALGGVRTASQVVLDLNRVDSLDTAAAMVLLRQIQIWRGEQRQVQLTPKDGAAVRLMRVVAKARRQAAETADPPKQPNVITRLGQAVSRGLGLMAAVISFFGRVLSALGATALRPMGLRGTSLVYHLQQTCVNAMPIVGLLLFTMGIVIAYLGAAQLQKFGAEIFVVDLIGIAMLREIGVLVVAILVAGRSGSAFAAELGTMTLTQEVDALRTLGLDPVRMLVVPRVLALMIALPLLTVYADLLGIAGGMVAAAIQLDISPLTFIQQLQRSVDPTNMLVGLIKAPVFALIIATVGCYQGVFVSGGAGGVGRSTTAAVVLSLFVVIIVNALFAIYFQTIGL